MVPVPSQILANAILVMLVTTAQLNVSATNTAIAQASPNATVV